MKDPLYRAVITAAEHHREIIDRHYTGRGAWFALVQAIKHPLRTEVGTIETLAAVECETRPEAVIMARQLLAEAHNYARRSAANCNFYCTVLPQGRYGG